MAVEGGIACDRFVSRARRLWTVDYFKGTGIARHGDEQTGNGGRGGCSTSRRCLGEAWLRAGAGEAQGGGAWAKMA